ncbi:MAG TPA: VOC family protein [Cytophagaceae bacterium]|nr:VOC family protein [Cytophagaceae bacterium]
MKIIQIKETCIYVRDLDITEKFYRETFGFELISKVPGRHVFFRAGSSVLLCFNPEKTKEDTSLPPHFGYGTTHLAFEVEPAEYESSKTKILEKNISIIHEQVWKPGIHSFYFHDPDGHVLEIVPKGMWD